MSETLATYSLELIGKRSVSFVTGRPHVLQLTRSILRETEENLTDLLPDGYFVQIREWDDDGARNFCEICGGSIYWAKRARRWLHENTPWNPPHPAQPAAREELERRD